MPARNLLMFSLDDMRALDDWGHFTPLISTPNIDRLVEAGTTFDRAITQIPLCNPARTSVMTGLQPSQTGVLENNVPWFERVDPATTLPAVLKAADVYVAMYGKFFHDHTISAAARAVMFDEFLPRGGDGDASQVVNDGVKQVFPFRSGRYVGPANTLPDELTVDAAVDFLQDTAGSLSQPFFLGVGIYRPHYNWWVPPEYFNRYNPAQIRAALQRSLDDGTMIPGAEEYADVPPMSVPSSEHDVIGPNFDQWADYIHGYLAAISYADAKVGEVLDALEADPALAAGTSILLWSDHGFHLGDKDRWHKFTHWREATEVPFIVVDPDVQGGRTAHQVVSLVDLFPTVLDMMGVEAPSNIDLQGNSLLPIVQNVNIAWYDPPNHKGVALTTIFGSVSIRAHVPGSGDLRYTRYPDGTEELYKLGPDPKEHTNRLNFETGAGLTPADNQLRTLMGNLMDAQLADAGILFSDGDGQVQGSSARETLVSTAGPGENDLAGAGGNDTYILYRDAIVREAAGGGIDSVVIRNPNLEKTFVLPANIEIVQVMSSFTGNDQANKIFAGFEEVEGLVTDEAGLLNGAGGNDVINGDAGNDTIDGGSGADRLLGDTGLDILIGGLGSDTLSGGPNADTFRFTSSAASTPALSDVIERFEGAGGSGGDRIDLAAIDANVLISGNQKFVFGGTAAGRVRFAESGGDSVLLANTDADAAAELRVVFRDGGLPATAYSAEDVIL